MGSSETLGLEAYLSKAGSTATHSKVYHAYPLRKTKQAKLPRAKFEL